MSLSMRTYWRHTEHFLIDLCNFRSLPVQQDRQQVLRSCLSGCGWIPFNGQKCSGRSIILRMSPRPSISHVFSPVQFPEPLRSLLPALSVLLQFVPGTDRLTVLCAKVRNLRLLFAA